ncbi:SdiA-regulated [Arachidicoccus rhizosphaerae]|jgi:hypothetical protein|uniref:SdiA-regulated n=1 Tax=Arachidicoccus rhizosphaerae TaxID=551991 RepID=A0A1H3WW77_9BACT|nr:DUF295 domain-containing protein [Arachidicoccus rhizosphaerae]SDZ91416.1 SdiA-regulated [Arachidicoccus rhizosphaerae]
MKILSILSAVITLGSSLSLPVVMASCRSGQPGRQADSTVLTATQHSTAPESAAAQNDFAYRLSQPTAVYQLPEELREVSGIRFLQSDSLHIYAEQDEKGRLYQLAPGDKQANYVDFGKDGDYEDLVFLGGKAIFLRSDGDLFSIDLPASFTATPTKTVEVQHIHRLVPKGEYEGLYADTATSQLYMLCKQCAKEDHKKSTSVYRLDLNGGKWVRGASFQVDVTRISEMAYARQTKQKGKKKKHEPATINFKPSAICRNPATGEWYLLSSINKMLVVTGSDWQVKSVQPLPPGLYPQPEGMCFDKDGNLYISNEGQSPGGATLLKFTPVS